MLTNKYIDSHIHCMHIHKYRNDIEPLFILKCRNHLLLPTAVSAAWANITGNAICGISTGRSSGTIVSTKNIDHICHENHTRKIKHIFIYI